MIATSGAHTVRERTARTAASIIRPAGRPARAARRAAARAARESLPCRPETAAALRRAAARLLPQDALQLVRDADAKVLDAERLVPPQPAAELLPAHVERREMEGAFAHAVLGPKSAVPTRITVAPSSTATP